MQENGVNMLDIRKALGIKSLRWKIERRILAKNGSCHARGRRPSSESCNSWLGRTTGKQRESEGREKKNSSLREKAPQRSGNQLDKDWLVDIR